MNFEKIYIIGLAVFGLFVLFSVWRVCCYDESESFLYNVGVTLLALLFWFVIAPAVLYAILGGCAKTY